MERIREALERARQDALCFHDAKSRIDAVEGLAERVEKHLRKLEDTGRFDNDEQYIGYFFPQALIHT
ncbi:MAG: hypothetical protein MZU97_27185 [Bacillus subtilis]|nr:hypothetical protein [Bacillus subtilis]